MILLSEMKNEKESFYMYEAEGLAFWFCQNNWTGNIYAVSFYVSEEFKEFEFCIGVGADTDGNYYPNSFALRPRSYKLKPENAEEYINKLKTACKILDEVENFFYHSQHYEKFKNTNK